MHTGSLESRSTASQSQSLCTEAELSDPSSSGTIELSHKEPEPLMHRSQDFAQSSFIETFVQIPKNFTSSGSSDHSFARKRKHKHRHRRSHSHSHYT
jgi:hypothetical protein